MSSDTTESGDSEAQHRTKLPQSAIDAIARLVAAAPPMTDEQVRIVGRLLSKSPTFRRSIGLPPLDEE